MSDIVWYRYVHLLMGAQLGTGGVIAVLPEHPGDAQGETCLAFVRKGSEWSMITTTFDRVLAATEDAFYEQLGDLPAWLKQQGYDVEPRRFTRESVDAERWRRAHEEFYPPRSG